MNESRPVPFPAEPVRVEGGLIAGVADDRAGARAFLGIPYAAPPVGERRWRPPQPVTPWAGVRPADRYAPQCVQPGRAEDSVYAEFAGRQAMSEDCLTLNVWTPAQSPRDALPVMVWIHGGAFQQGSAANPVFVRGTLPRQGIVLVTINYRLGPFGFLAHPELTAEGSGASGNYGLLDMTAALAWVQRNIASFGGDPAQVTVFGQSAGAHGVIALLASPEARGLFRHAIAQSFGIAATEPLASAEATGHRYARDAGAADIAALRRLSAEELLRRYLAQPVRFMPIVDGRFLTRPLAETFAAGAQQAVPLLTGWNRDEGSAFPAMAGGAEALRAHLQERFGARAAEAEALYPAGDDGQAEASSRALFGDGLFARGVLAAARAQSRLAPTYVYHYAHVQPFRPGQRFREADPATRLGAFHSSEYPHVFGTTRELTRDWSPEDDRLTALMQGYWCRFARTGDPNATGDATRGDAAEGDAPEGYLPEDDAPEGRVPVWPRFDETRPTVLELSAKPALVDVPRRAQLNLLG